MSDAASAALGHCELTQTGSAVSRSSRISSAVSLLRPVDPHHVFHNLPCCVVPLVRVSFAFSQTVVPALLAGQDWAPLLLVFSRLARGRGMTE
jgi:hypothetical protein